MAMRLSMRASAAPRQLCTPWPKPIAIAGRALDVEVVGVARTRAGRASPRPVMSSTGKPAGNGAALELARPATQNRPWYCDGGQVAQDLLDRPGIAVGVVAHLLPLVGVREKSTTALPTSFVTVSAPAPPSSVAKPAISSSSRPVSLPSPRSTVTWVRRDSMSSAGFFALLGGELVK